MNNKPSLFSHRVLMPTFFGAAWKAMRNEAAEESESQQRRLHTGAGKLLGKGSQNSECQSPIVTQHVQICPNMSKMLAFLLEIPFGDWNNQACTHINDKDHGRSATKLSQSAPSPLGHTSQARRPNHYWRRSSKKWCGIVPWPPA